MPESDEEIAELRERVRAEHQAYLRKWASWSPQEQRRDEGLHRG